MSSVLVLASASIRRKHLLENAGFNIEVCCNLEVDEICSERDAKKLVQILALKKAKAVESENCILGADTVVVFDGEILGKPRNKKHAKQMLSSLCGKTHKVWTGVALRYKNKELIRAQSTKVSFNNMSYSEISTYVEQGCSDGKAGGYGLQDAEFEPFVKEILGARDNVIGLPVETVREMIIEIKKE